MRGLSTVLAGTPAPAFSTPRSEWFMQHASGTLPCPHIVPICTSELLRGSRVHTYTPIRLQEGLPVKFR
jgi:hypothetical protein